MLDLLQWPALAVTVAAVWLVASDDRPRRFAGFVLLLLSNALWAAWGVGGGAWGIVALQAALLIPAALGVARNRTGAPASGALSEAPGDETPWSTRPDADYRALVRDGIAKGDLGKEASRPPSVRRAA